MARRKRQIAKTAAELARLLKVHPTTARRWLRKGCPRLEDGTFDVEAVAAWLHTYRSESKDRTKPAGKNGQAADVEPGLFDDPLRVARTKREEIKAEREALQLRALKRDMVPLSELAGMLAKRMHLFRREGRSMSRRLSDVLLSRKDRSEVQRLIDREFDRILWQAWGEVPEEYRQDA